MPELCVACVVHQKKLKSLSVNMRGSLHINFKKTQVSEKNSRRHRDCEIIWMNNAAGITVRASSASQAPHGLRRASREKESRNVPVSEKAPERLRFAKGRTRVPNNSKSVRGHCIPFGGKD